MSNSAGLEGVIAGETALSTVGKEGVGLTYLGYDIHELAEKASFEEVSYLLLKGALPTQRNLEAFVSRLQQFSSLPQPLKDILEKLPATSHPMDVMRTTVSALGCLSPESGSLKGSEIAERLLAQLPGALLYWYHYAHKGNQISTEMQASSIAEHFLSLLHQRSPDAEHQRAIDVSLVLYAEHEFNASTFNARVCAGTASDLYSCITGAIGTLRGPLHGGANEMAMALVDAFSDADAAEKGIRSKLQAKEKIMGFGHRVYRISDPRSDVVKSWAFKLAKGNAEKALLAKFEVIERLMKEEKGLFPNLDFYAAAVYRYCDIPTALFTPIFVMARTAGWAAHVFEQRKNNRLIRPTAHYIGHAQRPFVSMAARTEESIDV